MSQRAISLFTLAGFVLLATSCVTWRTKNIGGITDAPGRGAMVMTVVKTSGERIEFAKSDPGRVRGLAIQGTALVRFSVPLEIQGPFSAIKARPDGSVYEVTDGAGRVHQVLRVSKRGTPSGPSSSSTGPRGRSLFLLPTCGRSGSRGTASS